jgi:hypothetical protein
MAARKGGYNRVGIEPEPEPELQTLQTLTESIHIY